MKKYDVYAKITGIVYMGEYEANSPEEAGKKMLESNRVDQLCTNVEVEGIEGTVVEVYEVKESMD